MHDTGCLGLVHWDDPEGWSGEDLQIAVKRREEKSQGEKERYKHLNAEFQRIARRDKKAWNSLAFSMIQRILAM